MDSPHTASVTWYYYLLLISIHCLTPKGIGLHCIHIIIAPLCYLFALTFVNTYLLLAQKYNNDKKSQLSCVKKFFFDNLQLTLHHARQFNRAPLPTKNCPSLCNCWRRIWNFKSFNQLLTKTAPTAHPTLGSLPIDDVCSGIVFQKRSHYYIPSKSRLQFQKIRAQFRGKWLKEGFPDWI